LFFIYPYLFAFFFLFWKRIFYSVYRIAKKIEKYESRISTDQSSREVNRCWLVDCCKVDKILS